MRLFDVDGAFHTPSQQDGLRDLAVKGAGVTIFTQGAGFATQLISTMVLARLLTPADFGIVTMVTTFSILLMSCGQVGFPDAIRQWDDINHDLASNLFWINAGLGLLLMFAFASTAPLLAKLYRDPKIVNIVFGVSLGVFFNNIAVVPIALLTRAMCFSASCTIDIAARFTSVALSVGLALSGWGYWALVAGTVAYPLGQTIGAFAVCRWVPSLPKRVPETRAMVSFAAKVFARYSVYYSTRNTDNLLVGWRFGPVMLGLYKKAYDLFILPFSLLQVYAVAGSTLSRLKNNREEYLRYLLSGLSVLALISMAAAGELTVAGKDLVLLALGQQWERAGEIFTLFAPGTGIMMVYMTYGVIHLSLGTPGRFFRWTILEFVVTVFFFIAGLHWGPEGVAVGWNASYVVLFVPAFLYAGRPISLRLLDVLEPVWKPAVGSAISVGLSELILSTGFLARTGSIATALVNVICKSVIFTGLYAGCIVLLHGSWEPLLRLRKLLLEMLPSKRVSTSLRKTAVVPAQSSTSV